MAANTEKGNEVILYYKFPMKGTNVKANKWLPIQRKAFPTKVLH